MIMTKIDRYEVLRSVGVEVIYGGQPKGMRVGVGQVDPAETSPQLFGLIFEHYDTRLSHMSYGLDYFLPADALDHAETTGQGWMWFDAGTTCTEIKISADELRRAFTELEMIPGE
jgi:hypothetical protein